MDRRDFIKTAGGIGALAAINGTMPLHAADQAEQTHTNDFGRYDFGLTEAQEQRAAMLHRESIVIDLMCQGPIGYRSITDAMLTDIKAEWDATGSSAGFRKSLNRLNELLISGGIPDFMAVWRATGLTAANYQVSGDIRDGAHLPRIQAIDAYREISLARNGDDIRAAKQRGEGCRFLNYQTLPATVTDHDWFDEAIEAGILMGGLTYNTPTQFGVGCKAVDTGITAFGKEAIARMNEVGMLVDVAHAGQKTTITACKASKAPVVASHAGAAAVFAHDRSKSDDALKALADTDGLCGVLTVPFYLTHELPGSIELTIRHIEYIAGLVGIDHVAVGTDWPMMLPKWVSAPGGPFDLWTLEQGFSDSDLGDMRTNIIGFDDYRDMPNLTRGMVKSGFSDEEIRKVLGGNALRVFDQVLN